MGEGLNIPQFKMFRNMVKNVSGNKPKNMLESLHGELIASITTGGVNSQNHYRGVNSQHHYRGS